MWVVTRPKHLLVWCGAQLRRARVACLDDLAAVSFPYVMGARRLRICCSFCLLITLPIFKIQYSYAYYHNNLLRICVTLLQATVTFGFPLGKL